MASTRGELLAPIAVGEVDAALVRAALDQAP